MHPLLAAVLVASVAAGPAPPVAGDPAGRPETAAPPGQPRVVDARALNLSTVDGDNAALVAPTATGRREPLAFRVFATREGLAGHTTANGHVITERDHFVALPSRRALSARGTGDYTVRVCAQNGRCAWAPVWDVGPWNTRDDYWNPVTRREMWADLPRGTAQAQAAHLHGYHEGRDQYGRPVRNPAGIDLADGTFWDGLRLATNAWVTVSYLWTATGPAGTVDTPGDVLNVRTGAGTRHAAVGLAAHRAQVRVECRVTGQQVTGTQGASNQWLRVAPGQYVAAAYVAAPAIPTCG